MKDSIVALWPPTCPLRSPGDLLGGIATFEQAEKAVFAVAESYENPYHMIKISDSGDWTTLLEPDLLRAGDTQSQGFTSIYKPSGGFFIVPVKTLVNHTSRSFYDNVRPYVIPRERSYDIDDASDLELCRMILSEGSNGN